jgi:hypothetical protein
VAKTQEVTLDAQAPPPRGFWLASRTTSSPISSEIGGRPVSRVGPPAFHQPPAQGQQGARRHDPMSTKVLRQQSSQDGDHSAVSPIRFRARDLTAQDRDLVPQYR